MKRLFLQWIVVVWTLLFITVFIRVGKRSEVVVTHPVEETYTNYDPTVAFADRKRIFDAACDNSHLEDVETETFRRFLLNHGATFCVPEFENSAMVSAVLEQLVDEKADSELSSLDPCARETLDRMTVQEENKERTSCRLEEEVGRLPFKAVVVQHPMERLAHSYSLLQQQQKDISFVSFLNSLQNMKPYWRSCKQCSEAYRPNVIMKYEYLNADLASFLTLLNLTEYLDNLPPEVMEAEATKPSGAAEKLFSQVKREDIIAVYELLRTDHELFGYDSSPYILMGM